MTEYYYTQSLATAAAAIEQGFDDVESTHYDAEKKDFWYKGFFQIVDSDYECCKWRFPKTPHNVALMEKKVFDVVVENGSSAGNVYCYGNGDLYASWGENDHAINDNMVIIARKINEKYEPFPVWDKDEV